MYPISKITRYYSNIKRRYNFVIKINNFHHIKIFEVCNSKTYHNDDWVKVEVIVNSNKIVQHIVENDTVISYSNLRVGGDKIPENYLNRIGEPLVDGYISLQSEGHPVEFRNIRIKKFNID